MRYHINKNNEPAPCHAKSPESCPCRGNGDVDENGDLIGNGHYASLEEATRAVEHKLEMKNQGYARQIKKRVSRMKARDIEVEHESEEAGPWASATDRMSRMLDSNADMSVSDLVEMRRLTLDDDASDRIGSILESMSVIDGKAAIDSDETIGSYMDKFSNLPYRGADARTSPYVKIIGDNRDWDVALADSVRSRKWSQEEFSRLVDIGVIEGESGSITDGWDGDFAEDNYSADSAFVWKLDKTNGTVTGCWTSLSYNRDVALTDPIPLSRLRSSVHINDDDRSRLKQAMRSSRKKGSIIDKAKSNADAYRNGMANRGYSLVGQHIIDGDKIIVERENGDTAEGTVRISVHGPEVEFDDPGLDFDLYVDRNDRISTALDEYGDPKDYYLVPTIHKSRSGEITHVKSMEMIAGEGNDILSEVDRRLESYSGFSSGLEEKQRRLREDRVHDYRKKLLDEEAQHRAQYDKKNVVYKFLRPYKSKWTDDAIKKAVAEFDRVEKSRDHYGYDVKDGDEIVRHAMEYHPEGSHD